MKTFSAKPEAGAPRLVPRERRGPDARPAGDRARPPAARQAQARLYPARRHGRLLVVINAEKIRVTGRKLKDKIYYRHTGTIGNMKSRAAREAARPRARARDRDRRQGHAAAEPARPADVQEAQGRARHGPSAPGPAAETVGALAMATASHYGTGRRKTSAARVFLRPARATSTSTAGRSTCSSAARPPG